MNDYIIDKINNNKIYNFPEDMVAKQYGRYLILIAPSKGNWIILENQIQIDIIKKLKKGIEVKKVINKYINNYEYDLNAVLLELEGKHFCEKINISEDSFTLRLYLTNKCNLRCKHCFIYAVDELENELSYNEIIDLLDKSKANGCKKVIFTGGEVAIRKEFLDILKYAYKIGLYIQVLTNGVMWNDDLIKELAQYINEIQISIDGFDEKTNALVRGKGTFNKAMKTIEKFIKYDDIFVSIITTPTYELIENHKQDYINFGKDMINKFGTKNFLVIFGEELIDGRDIKVDENRNNNMSKIVSEIYEEIYENAELTTFIMNHSNNRVYMNCGYGGLTIDSNGDIFFCGRIKEVKCYGNIRNMNFKDVIDIRKKAREISYVDNIKPCNECDIRYICGGGCRIKYIKEITNLDLSNIHIFERSCTEEHKNNIYRLMIESNEYLYW